MRRRPKDVMLITRKRIPCERLATEAPLGGDHRPNARVIPAGPSGFGDSCGSAKPTPGALRGGVFVSNARPELELSHRVLKPRNNRRRQVYPLIMFKWRASRPRHVLPVGESSIR